MAERVATTEDLNVIINRMQALIDALEGMVPTATVCQELNKARNTLGKLLIQKEELFGARQMQESLMNACSPQAVC